MDPQTDFSCGYNVEKRILDERWLGEWTEGFDLNFHRFLKRVQRRRTNQNVVHQCKRIISAHICDKTDDKKSSLCNFLVRVCSSSFLLLHSSETDWQYFHPIFEVYWCWTLHLEHKQIIHGCQKCFARGVRLWFRIATIMNFIPDESPWKMGSRDMISHS